MNFLTHLSSMLCIARHTGLTNVNGGPIGHSAHEG